MALVRAGWISLICFSVGLLSILSTLLCVKLSVTHSWSLSIVYSVVAMVAIKVIYKGGEFKIAVRALLLGLVMSFSLMVCFSDYSFRLIGWYLAALAFFHWSEYFTTAYTNPKNLSLESYLLDHSKEYHIAAAGSLCEFLIEWYFFSGFKQPQFFSVIGLIIVIFGDSLRKLAMVTASTNFNHYVQHSKSEEHRLVTEGIYGYFRHPAYVGWFYWSLGTQLMICNPVCLVGYVYASWSFFNSRIYDEEIALLGFFGEKYVKYQSRVPTGLPLIKGYRID